MSEYGIVLESGAVRFERLLPGPIERVWAYITEGGKRSTWFCGGETEPRVGGKVALLFKHSEITDERPPEGADGYRFQWLAPASGPARRPADRHEAARLLVASRCVARGLCHPAKRSA